MNRVVIDGNCVLNNSIDGEVSLQSQIDGSAVQVIEVNRVEYYTGAYEFTPGANAITIPCENLTMTEDLVINPVPSNYGLITWNGSTLTVS